MPAALEISALPKDKKFYITMADDFGQFKHGPCKVNKHGIVVHVSEDGTQTPVRTDLPIVAYEVIEEAAKQPWDL